MVLEWITDIQREYRISERNAINARIFGEAVQRLLRGADTACVDRWVEFARENVSHEQYVDFAQDEQMAIGRWLGALFAGLYQMERTYGAEIAEKLWNCSLHHYCLYPQEMFPMVEHLQKGGPSKMWNT